jgi:hypothetical protein
VQSTARTTRSSHRRIERRAAELVGEDIPRSCVRRLAVVKPRGRSKQIFRGVKKNICRGALRNLSPSHNFHRPREFFVTPLVPRRETRAASA